MTVMKASRPVRYFCAFPIFHDPTVPMPPLSEPPVSASQRAILDGWIDAGMPAGTCGVIAAKPVATTCASNSVWTQGDTGAKEMNPGRPCRTCHQLMAPQLAYFFAGTVYPSFHERDLCNSPPPPDARIEILDDTGTVRLTLLPTARATSHPPRSPPASPSPTRRG